eukprot:363344-Chlamydomonas_euryale.AAC.7
MGCPVRKGPVTLTNEASRVLAARAASRPDTPTLPYHCSSQATGAVHQAPAAALEQQQTLAAAPALGVEPHT